MGKTVSSALFGGKVPNKGIGDLTDGQTVDLHDRKYAHQTFESIHKRTQMCYSLLQRGSRLICLINNLRLSRWGNHELVPHPHASHHLL